MFHLRLIFPWSVRTSGGAAPVGRLLQFVVLAAAVLSSVALIVAAWVGTGALAWVRRATAISTVARSSWSAEIHVGFASFDGLDDCSLSTEAGYEIELGIGKEVLELAARFPKNLYVGDVLSGELVGNPLRPWMRERWRNHRDRRGGFSCLRGAALSCNPRSCREWRVGVH